MPMRRILLVLLLAAILLLAAGMFVVAQEPPKGTDPTPAAPTAAPTISPTLAINRNLLPKIEPQLLKKLLQGETAPFIAYLKTQANVNAAIAAAGLSAQAQPDPLARRQIMVNALRQTANQSQAGVLQFLNTPAAGVSAQSALPAGNINPLWIVNAVAATGPLETVLALAARSDVAIVRLDKQVQIDRPALSRFSRNRELIPHQQTAEWGISKIRADLVRNALQIDGAGVVVANIDTGVDWLHPDLQTRYRGYAGPGKTPNHTGNWFDATGQGATYPADTNGHGTHTMGTMVGQNGIGVAPGAQWIAARAFNGNSALNSWLHAAFQWVLAPNGNPALAPDVVNNSWGSSYSASEEFKTDIQHLLDAGILPVFSAGNDGPGSGTVGSPGSLPEALAVGATDSSDAIASFSSRGPSPWSEIKPEVSAPGKNVRSTLPGGAYGTLSGTSMAAPHVSGLAALLFQADSSLRGDAARLESVLKSTAVRLGSAIPNNDYGWGRVDAYSAVMAVAGAGTLSGTITQAGSGAPISGAVAQITPSLGGVTISAAGNSSGVYAQGLAAATYDVTASAFGYQPQTVLYVTITTGTTTVKNFSLQPTASGFITGTITDQLSGQPLTATVSVAGTPVSTTTFGSYRLQLPVGVYTVTVAAAQHRISQTANISILAGVTATQNFALESAPSILLVDSGLWYQSSQLEFFKQALTDARYTADTWQIAAPFDASPDIPGAATLAKYDIVIWSAPADSPGYIGADDELKAYLDGGGRLLLSGQDVAYFDGGGYLFTADYLKNYLMTSFVLDNGGVYTVTGVAGQPLEGLSVAISGGNGANNQVSPDVVAVANTDYAGPLLAYQNTDYLAGVHVGLCRPYRAIFLPFGLEGISTEPGRSQMMGRAIAWLQQSPAAAGVELTPITATLVGNFGETVSHSIRVRNTGSSTDTIGLNLIAAGPHNWPTGGVPGNVTLGSCQSQPITATVQLPADHLWHITDTLAVAVQSGNNAAFTAVVTRSTKTPAPVLLVDDDRWYSFANEFKQALQANDIGFDYWYVPKSWSGTVPPSPPTATLKMYPQVVWYTAYDWYQPLTIPEEDRLITYLDGGGRLFFSSQDFLYRHLLNHGGYAPLAQTYLGVQAHTEDFSSTVVTGNPQNPASAGLGPYSLTFPAGYRNWTDAVTPTAQAQIFTVGNKNQVNGLTNAGVGSGGQYWHTNFLTYGPELLSQTDRARLLQRSVGWLSWMGRSTVTATAATLENGATIAYTATLINDGWDAITTAYFTATFPASLTPGLAAPELNFDGSQFSWSGPLAVGEPKILTYTAQINQPVAVGAVFSQTNWLDYANHNLLFDRITNLAATPNLGSSRLEVTPTQNIKADDVLTYTIVLQNGGFANSPAVTTTGTLPGALTLLGIDGSAPGVVTNGDNSFTWTTALPRNATAVLTYYAVVSDSAGLVIKNAALVDDGLNPAVEITAQAWLKTTPVYLPVIQKNN